VKQLSFDFGSTSNFTGEAEVVLEKRFVKQLLTIDRREWELEQDSIFSSI